MSPRGRLDLIRDEVSRLEGEGHAAGAHADTVADADGAELVAYYVGFCEGGLDALAEGEEVAVASGWRGVGWG